MVGSGTQWPAPPGVIRTPCDRDDHGSCKHRWGFGVTLLTGRRTVTLCRCPCHDKCPVTRRAGRRRLVPEEVWLEQCVCPGAEGAKARTTVAPRDDTRANSISAPKRVVTLLRLGLRLRDAYRKQTEERGVPEVVVLNDRSTRIRDLAIDLARNEREDEDAVGELVALTGRHRRDAEIAALDLRRENSCHESRTYNRAYRLLQAALASEPIAQPTPADIALMEVVNGLRQMPPEVRFRALAAKEPRLQEVERLVQSGDFGVRMDPEILSLPVDERRASARAWLESEATMRKRLLPLVGPEAEVDDLALRSYFAQDSVENYLRGIAQ